ncbi:leucine efflux protein LeuE [Actinomadura parmotrematis]|uniref:Leucine efflux protein LeuE n=1 Tax=Actinomadura parmotrematis TaxID=2864039 RepID=A0ABS7FLF5_9ACTN|nr:leucine efflux protein LeuE [Actinomadura parmotrematis]MBW8481201.1 leucine efflux protein LeuE [Actinomadura parmotrematis]
MFFGVVDIWTFTAGAFFIIILPGPNSMYVLSTAARHGIGTGYRAALGVFTGDTLLMVLAATGAASLLRSAPAVFTAIKWAGAAYLAVLGARMIYATVRGRRRRGAAPDPAPAAAGAAAEPATVRPYRKALLLCLLNPKAILFFAAFFVQFVDPGYGTPALPFVVLGLIVQAFSLAHLSALIFGGAFLVRWFRGRRRLAAFATGAVGALFVSFAVKLGTASAG